MTTSTVRAGQAEVGIVEFQGQQFHAMGACVRGRDVCGYTHTDKRGRLSLRRWDGAFWFRSRADVVGEYRDHDGDDTYAVVFLLPRGRAIAGYALGLDGMLFRGELCDADDAGDVARSLSDYWMQIDAEDAESSDADPDHDSDDFDF